MNILILLWPIILTSQETEAEGWQVQDLPGLQSEFMSSLSKSGRLLKNLKSTNQATLRLQGGACLM